MLVSFSKLPDFVFHRRKKRLKCKRYIWIIESLYMFCTVWITQSVTGIFLFMHDPIAEKDCVHMFRRTLSLLKIVIVIGSVNIVCSVTHMASNKPGQRWGCSELEQTFMKLSQRNILQVCQDVFTFLVLIPKKNAWTFRCLLLKLGLHAREDNSDMFGFVVLGDGAHWLDRMTFFFFFLKETMAFVPFLPRAIWAKWMWSRCDKFQRRWRRRSTSCSYTILREKEKIFHVRRPTALFPGLLLS